MKNTSKGEPVKFTRSEFKTLIKECLKELIHEGALNHVIQQPQMMVPVQQFQQPPSPLQNLAQSMAKGNPAQAQMYENILASAAGTMQEQNHSDPLRMMDQGNMFGNMNMGMQQQQFQEPVIINNSPNGMIPPSNMNQQPQNAVASKWAQLAFNSPIRNRPQSGNERPANEFGKFG